MQPATSLSFRTRGLLALLALLLCGAAPYFGRFMNANERPRLLQGIAWIETGTSAIDGPATGHIASGIDVSRAPDGHLYPNKPPGTTVPAAATYAGLRLLATVTGAEVSLKTYTLAARVLGGALPVLVILWLAARRIRSRDPQDLHFALVAYALATPTLSYGRLLYGHTLAAACLFAGIVALERRAEKWPLASVAAGGALAGSAVAVEYLAAFAGLPIGVWLLLRWRRDRDARRLIAAVGGAFIPISGLALYHHWVFGSILSTPYHHVVDAGFAAIHGQGILGLSGPTANSLYEHLLSPWGGLLLWAPLLVLAWGTAARALWRRESTELETVGWWVFTVLTLLSVCLMQTGGWRVGPRYLVVAFPLLLPALARLGRVWRARPVARWVLIGVLGTSMLSNFFAAALFPHLVPAGNPLGDLLLPLWAEGMRPYSPLDWVGLGEGVLGLLGLVSLVAFVAVTWPQEATGRARALWAAGVALALALFVGQSSGAAAPDAEVSFDLVSSIWEPGGPKPAPSRGLAP